ncbi:MAG: lipoate--protein ligase family protein [Oscillospiraceae bacterium]
MLTVLNSSHDPFYNQAFEEYVYQTFLDDDVFLLWQNDPAVIVGSYQNICREVHVERLRQLGIPVIRRITGGGTVYHDLGNLNYTYISDGGAAIDYDQCLGPILAALNDIGVPARKNRTCDIAIGDLKISGSAQRMTKGPAAAPRHPAVFLRPRRAGPDHHPPEKRLLPEQGDPIRHLPGYQYPGAPGPAHDH